MVAVNNELYMPEMYDGEGYEITLWVLHKLEELIKAGEIVVINPATGEIQNDLVSDEGRSDWAELLKRKPDFFAKVPVILKINATLNSLPWFENMDFAERWALSLILSHEPTE